MGGGGACRRGKWGGRKERMGGKVGKERMGGKNFSHPPPVPGGGVGEGEPEPEGRWGGERE